MSEFFPKLKYVRADLKVELDCLNRIWLFCLSMPKKKKKKKNKKGQQVLIYQTFEKIDLANSKSDVDQLHTDKLKKCTKCFKDFKK